ncbi:MAG TPA: flippase [bacterium]|mgnify:CR=1 FL=1|nr:flippase [bacterium]HQI48311.1 flippase [bacterium]HQJ64201.1 flippase [bacterium]
MTLRAEQKRISLAENTLYSLLGFVTPLLLAFATIPLIITHLGTLRFGLLTIGWMVLGYFSLFDLGLGRTLVKVIGEKLAKNQVQELPVLYWTSLLLISGLGWCAAAVLYPLSGSLVAAIKQIPPELSMEAARTFRILILGIPFVVFTAGLQGVVEGQQNFRLVGLLRIINGFLTFGGSAAAALLTTRVDLICLVLLIGRILYGVLCFVIDLRILPVLRIIAIDLRHARSLLGFGGWLTVSNLVGPLLVYFDRFLVGAWISLAAVAYYVTPYEIVTKSNVLTTALISVLFPAFAGQYAIDCAEAAAIYLRARKMLALLLFPVAYAFVMAGYCGLHWWLGEEFARQGTIVMQLLAVGIFINGPAQIAFILIQAAGRPDFTAKWHLVQVPVYLGMLYFAMHGFGLGGAALAWALRVAIDAIVLFWFAGKLLRIPARNNRFFMVFMTAGSALLLALSLPRFSAAASIPLLLVSGAGYLWICWRWFLDKEERQRIAAGLQRWRALRRRIRKVEPHS